MYTILGLKKEFESLEKALQFIQDTLNPYQKTNRTPIMKIYKGDECVLKVQIVRTVITETYFID